MPKRGKAARGKHRWIGLKLNASFSENELTIKKIESLLNMQNMKLYDLINEKKRNSCIIKIKLENYKEVRNILESSEANIISITSSGKIRLVRLRMNEYFQRQIDG